MRKIVWSLIIFSLLIVIAMPTVMIVGFGMLPSIVAYVIDNTEEKYGTFCVGGLNFCGVFPYLLEIWGGDHSVDVATRMLTDIFTLAVMYGAAGMGWAIYLSLPPVVSSFIQVLNQRRLGTLKQIQRQIVVEWGEEVITDAMDQFDPDAEAAAAPPAPPR